MYKVMEPEVNTVHWYDPNDRMPEVEVLGSGFCKSKYLLVYDGLGVHKGYYAGTGSTFNWYVSFTDGYVPYTYPVLLWADMPTPYIRG